MHICACSKQNAKTTRTSVCECESKRRWKRQTQTTNNKIVMQDDNGDDEKTITTDDANQHLYTWNSHFNSAFATLTFYKMQKSMCECGAEAKMETIESDDKRQTSHVRRRQRWKNDHDGRCQSAFVHVERLILVPHSHIDFVQKSMCECGAKMGWKR